MHGAVGAALCQAAPARLPPIGTEVRPRGIRLHVRRGQSGQGLPGADRARLVRLPDPTDRKHVRDGRGPGRARDRDPGRAGGGAHPGPRFGQPGIRHLNFLGPSTLPLQLVRHPLQHLVRPVTDARDLPRHQEEARAVERHRRQERGASDRAPLRGIEEERDARGEEEEAHPAEDPENRHGASLAAAFLFSQQNARGQSLNLYKELPDARLQPRAGDFLQGGRMSRLLALAAVAGIAPLLGGCYDHANVPPQPTPAEIVRTYATTEISKELAATPDFKEKLKEFLGKLGAASTTDELRARWAEVYPDHERVIHRTISKSMRDFYWPVLPVNDGRVYVEGFRAAAEGLVES